MNRGRHWERDVGAEGLEALCSFPYSSLPSGCSSVCFNNKQINGVKMAEE